MVLGEYLIKLLEMHGVSHVFGIPGVHTVELYRGLAESKIQHILPRHEQGAGFMADGYARVTNQPGVCFVITGPGLTNILTPIGQAYADSIPMLVISGVNKRQDLGHGHGLLHEMPDQSAVLKPITAFSHTVQSVAELPGVLARAFAVFNGARPRPVHIQVPIDMMVAPVDVAQQSILKPTPLITPSISEEVVESIVAKIQSANAPLVLLGGGCRTSDSVLIEECIAKIGAPAIQTINGRNVLSSDNPLAVPVSSSLNAVRAAIADCDLLIAFGTEFGGTDYDMFCVGMPEIHCPIIRFDIDAKQLTGSQLHGRNTHQDILVQCDVSAAFHALNQKLSKPSSQAAELRARAICDTALQELSPDMQEGVRFLHTLRDAFPTALVVGDSTQPVYAGNLIYGTVSSGMWFNSSVGFGTLGYALPAAIGAKIGRPKQPVIALIGDGGLQFTLNEFGSIPSDFPIITLIWNNNGYEEIKTSMLAVGVEPVGVSIEAPDFAHIAKAYGLEFMQVQTMSALLKTISIAVDTNASIVIEINTEAGFTVGG